MGPTASILRSVNGGFDYAERIDLRGAGATVLVYLAGRYQHSREETWRARIEAGEVCVNGATAAALHRLRAGDRLVWRRPPWEEPTVPLAFAILYRDGDLLAVAKPRGLPSIPNGGFLEHTLLHLVRRHEPEATPLHRLGRGTSGLLLFARSERARRSVSAAWREGRVEKEYRALVAGTPAAREFSVDVPIGPVPHPRLGTVHGASPIGRPALTHVRCLGATRADGSTLVAVQIPTGRPHQIRIHLAAAGHPLVGDPLYGIGGIPRERPALPGDAGYRLHSLRLVVPHPSTGHPFELTCAPPPELREEVEVSPEA
jgi:23S rRNA pseudouridine1911/1915/1917 synthase